MKIRAVIFDLDGTLADSRLDFAAMRRDVGLADGVPILEALTHLEEDARERAHAIILAHELAGARRATPMPGARALVDLLRARGLRIGIFTRNARIVTELTLERLELAVDLIVAREDAPPKPAPDGLLWLLQSWGLAPHQALYVGDYLYDVEAGRRAAVRTVLYAPTPPDFAHDADEIIEDLADLPALVGGGG